MSEQIFYPITVMLYGAIVNWKMIMMYYVLLDFHALLHKLFTCTYKPLGPLNMNDLLGIKLRLKFEEIKKHLWSIPQAAVRIRLILRNMRPKKISTSVQSKILGDKLKHAQTKGEIVQTLIQFNIIDENINSQWLLYMKLLKLVK